MITKTIPVDTDHVRAIAAAITALTGTEHEAPMIALLRAASPFHPLLWSLDRIAVETARGEWPVQGGAL